MGLFLKGHVAKTIWPIRTFDYIHKALVMNFLAIINLNYWGPVLWAGRLNKADQRHVYSVWDQFTLNSWLGPTNLTSPHQWVRCTYDTVRYMLPNESRCDNERWIGEFVSFSYTHVPKEIWPPSSLDLNPMEYWAWSTIETQINICAHTTKTSILANIKENFTILDRDMVAWALGRFRGGIEALIEDGGDLIE